MPGWDAVGAALFRMFATLSLLFVVGISVVDVLEGRWWLATLRIAVIGGVGYGLYRSSRRRDR